MPGQERGTDERPPPGGRGPIYFVDLFPRPPIFTRDGYTEFVTTAYVAWGLLLWVVAAFRMELAISESLIASLAGSSVEMAALCLALLALLHQLSRADVWFKLALLLVSTLFVSAVLAGYAVAATWKDAYGGEHEVTVYAAVVILVAGLFQVPLHGRLGKWKMRGGRTFSVVQELKRVSGPLMAITWLAPFLAVWATGVRPSSAVLLLFCGATLSVLALVLIAIVHVVRHKPAPSPAESLLALELAQAQEEDARRKVHAALRTECFTALEALAAAAQSSNPVPLIPLTSLMARLREREVLASTPGVERVLRELVDEGRVFRQSYPDGLWPDPPGKEVAAAVDVVRSLALVYTQISPGHADGHGWIDGFELTVLADELAGRLKLPIEVAREYLLPNVLQFLRNEAEFSWIDLSASGHLVFVNRHWLDPQERRAPWCATLRFARSNDAPDRWLDVLKHLPQAKNAVPPAYSVSLLMKRNHALVLDALLSQCPPPRPMDDDEPF